MSSTEMQAQQLPPEYFQNPYPYYRGARMKDPVLPTQFLQGIDCIYVTGHQEVETILKDSRFVREIDNYLPPERRGNWLGRGAQDVPEEWGPLIKMQKSWMLMRDGADHVRLRTPVMKAFTPQVIERLRPHIEEIANSLIDGMKEQESPDIIRDFAFPLPCIVIAELLGVPGEDREKFKVWSSALASTLNPVATQEEMTNGAKAGTELMEYFRGLVEERRREPKDDLISELAGAEQLTEDEILAACVLLLAAGHETTVNLIGNGFVTLLRNPEQLALLKEQPDLYVNAIEEVLRYEPPVQLTLRFASEDVEFGGHLIKLGTPCYLVLAGANRDPQVFENPELFDVTRKNAGRHISFATGAHYCIGANLARVEGQIALRVLFERMSEIEWPADSAAWRQSLTFRGLLQLPVSAKID